VSADEIREISLAELQKLKKVFEFNAFKVINAV
jgi:hypothetical protein